jgi:hypothetical protein
MPLRNRLPKRNPLRTRPYRVASILYIRAIDELSIFRQDRSTNAETRIRAVSGGFGGGAACVQGRELGGGYGVRGAGLRDVVIVGGGEEGG